MARNEIRTDITAKDKTKAAFSSVQRSMKKLKVGVLAIGAAMTALGVGLIALGKKALNFADEIAKTADAIGFSTSALQELRVAADLAGISQGQLNSGLGAMSKRLGEMKAGTGALFTFFNKLNEDGFKRQILLAKDNESAFRLLVGRIQGLKNAQDRAALSAAAFGRTAGIMLSKLSLNEIDEGIERARALGLVIDESLLRNAEKIKDNFTLAGETFRINLMAQILEAMKDLDFKQVSKDLIEFATAAMNAAKWLGEFFGIIQKSRNKKIAELSKQLAEAENHLRHFQKVFKEATTAGDEARAWRNIQRTKREIEEITEAMEKLREVKTPPLKVTVDKGVIEESAKSTLNYKAAIESVGSTYKRVQTPLENFQKAAENTNQMLEDSAVRGLRQFEDALLSLGDKTASVADNFRAMANSIVKDLARMAIRQHVTGPLGGILKQGLGTIFNPEATGFGVGGTVGLGYAKGGYAPAGVPAIVGEQGPEMIVPGRRGATVIPNDKLGGGATIVNNYDFSGANPATIEVLRAEAERIKQETFASVFQAIDRGGSYAKISGRR